MAVDTFAKDLISESHNLLFKLSTESPDLILSNSVPFFLNLFEINYENSDKEKIENILRALENISHSDPIFSITVSKLFNILTKAENSKPNESQLMIIQFLYNCFANVKSDTSIKNQKFILDIFFEKKRSFFDFILCNEKSLSLFGKILSILFSSLDEEFFIFNN